MPPDMPLLPPALAVCRNQHLEPSAQMPACRTDIRRLSAPCPPDISSCPCRSRRWCTTR